MHFCCYCCLFPLTENLRGEYYTNQTNKFKSMHVRYDKCIQNPKWRGPLAKLRYRWKDRLKMDLKEIRFEDVDWICLVQTRVHCMAGPNTMMNL